MTSEQYRSLVIFLGALTKGAFRFFRESKFGTLSS